MNDVESSDDSNAHAVGELGRLDPAYQMSERVRAQTMEGRKKRLGKTKNEPQNKFIL